MPSDFASAAATDRKQRYHPGLASIAWLAMAQCLTLLLLAVMLTNKHRTLFVELTLSRMEIAAADLDGALRTGARSGLRPDEMRQVDRLLHDLMAAEPTIANGEVLRVARGRAEVVFASDAARVGVVLPEQEWRSIAGAAGYLRRAAADGPELSAVVRDGADEVVGGWRLRASPEMLHRAAEQLASQVWPQTAASGLAMVAATLLGLSCVRRRRSGSSEHVVLAVALLAMIGAAGYLAWAVGDLLRDSLAPAIEAKVAGVARLVAGKLERAQALGIPLERVPGIPAYLAELGARHSEVAALRVSTAGRLLADYGIAAGGTWQEYPAGASVRVGAAADAGFVSRRVGELAIDVGILLLVAVLVLRELLAALLSRTAGGMAAGDAPAGGMHGASKHLPALRLPLFLFILTEELSRSFLPLYVDSLAASVGALGRESAIGLPIAVYMLVFAVSTPFAGGWADRWGATRVFSAGVGLTVAGFLWTSLAGGYWQLLPARALCACGYATATMACQRELMLFSGAAQRARALAIFVAAVSIAAICGSALGGLLADQFGFRPVFAASAALALLALVAFPLLPAPPAQDAAAGQQLRVAELLRLVANRRFAALIFGGAIPAKVALAGLLFYLAPLVLQQFEYGPAAIGRALMLYFVLVAATNPLASRLSDRYGWRLSLTITGGVVIGVGALADWSGRLATEHAVWLAIAALGIGTGLATAPLQALASQIGAAAGATSVAVVLRTLERSGSVIGPVWAGWWLAVSGPTGAMAAIGVTVLAGTALCIAARNPRHDSSPP